MRFFFVWLVFTFFTLPFFFPFHKPANPNGLNPVVKLIAAGLIGLLAANFIR